VRKAPSPRRRAAADFAIASEMPAKPPDLHVQQAIAIIIGPKLPPA
jgi:hypothetical protein